MAENNNNVIVTTEKQAALIASEATQWLLGDIEAGKISAVPGYNVGSEVTSAFLKIMQTTDRNGKYAMDVCTKDSILLFLRDMAIQGLSVSRSQCYPVVYGNKLQLMRSYFGTQTVFQRMFPNLKVTANVLYQGDSYVLRRDEIGDFDYITDVTVSLENRDKPIVAAYGSIIDVTTKERVYGCVMTITEIKKSWSHAKTDKVQKEFPQEMAKRTVINRMLKGYVNASPTVSDPALFDAYNRTLDNEYENTPENLPEAEKPTDVDMMIRKKSKGSAGIGAILKAAEKPEEEVKPAEVKVAEAPSINENASKKAVEEFETADGEIIEVQEKDKPQPVFEEVPDMDSIPF